MTPAECRQYAEALPPLDRDVETRRLMLLYAAAIRTIGRTANGRRALRALRDEKLNTAEHFRRSNSPGHHPWYEVHLRDAETLCDLVKSAEEQVQLEA